MFTGVCGKLTPNLDGTFCTKIILYKNGNGPLTTCFTAECGAKFARWKNGLSKEIKKRRFNSKNDLGKASI